MERNLLLRRNFHSSGVALCILSLQCKHCVTTVAQNSTFLHFHFSASSGKLSLHLFPSLEIEEHHLAPRSICHGITRVEGHPVWVRERVATGMHETGVEGRLRWLGNSLESRSTKLLNMESRSLHLVNLASQMAWPEISSNPSFAVTPLGITQCGPHPLRTPSPGMPLRICNIENMEHSSSFPFPTQ